MEKYIHVTGKILSRDSYREEQWDQKKQESRQINTQVIRVEYCVNGRIYTHSFTGEYAQGEVGDDYSLYYREDAPEYVRTEPGPAIRPYFRITLAMLAAIILVCLVMLLH